MFKPAWMSLIAAALAVACGADPVVEPSQQTPQATPEVAPPAEPAAAADPFEATLPAPDQPPPPAVSKPEQVASGKYRVCAASEPTAKDVEPWVRRLEAGGLHVQTEPTDVKGKIWQRVIVPGLRNSREARQMVAYIDQVLGIKGAWVVPQKAAAAAPAAPAKAAAPMPAPAAPAPATPEPKVPDAEHPKN